jgi:hypothetical protein
MQQNAKRLSERVLSFTEVSLEDLELWSDSYGKTESLGKNQGFDQHTSAYGEVINKASGGFWSKFMPDSHSPNHKFVGILGMRS